MTIYDYSIPKTNGEELKLADLKGKVLLIVNTATGCGFTPQYEAIETLYEKYHDKGLEVIDIPCNQFGHQTPGTDAEVHEFCQLHYNTKFEQMKKSDVNGANELPLYTYLKSQKGFKGFGEHKLAALLTEMLEKADKDWALKPDIKWNFTKFLVSREGVVVERFEPTTDMKEVEAKIIKLF
jgi:glutathione peroxidase